MKRIDFNEEVTVLRQSGMCCAQIVTHAGLKVRGEENKQLVDAARTLCLGIQSKKVCGALTGGALMLGLWDSDKTKAMAGELSNWFESEFGTVVCGELMEKRKTDERCSCANLIRASINKAQDILVANGQIEG